MTAQALGLFLFTASLYLVTLLSFGFAAVMFFGAAPRKLNLLWIFTCISIGVWSFGLAKEVSVSSLSASYFWTAWVCYTGASLVPAFFYHFVCELTGNSNRKSIVLGYLGALIFLALSYSGKLLGIYSSALLNFYTLPKPIYWTFTVYYGLFATLSHFLLFKELFRSQGERRSQLAWVSWSTLVGFSGGATTFLPIFGFEIIPLGVILVLFYVPAVSYAIFRYRLLDVNLGIRRTLVYSIVVLFLGTLYLALIYLGARTVEPYLGLRSTTSALVAVGLVILLFEPLRRWTQQMIDRLFLRERIDALPVALRDEVLNLYSSGLSHELKAPLAHILAPAELTLLELRDLEKQSVSTDKVLSKAQERLQYIIDQVMEASRRFEALRGGRGELDLEPVNIREVIESAVNENRSLSERKKAQIIPQVAADGLRVRGHRKQLEIVFINLIKNALESGAKTVTIRAQVKTSHVEIQVEDNGEGISAKDAAHIFEPHFTTKGKSGTGIGLYLCRQIIDRHKGQISARSNREKGTAFTVLLPRHG